MDLIIFYLSTGRADSLKEALLLVDKQRQTDQISNAINQAAQHISFTMKDATYRLAGIIDSCFNNLSNQINIGIKNIISTQNKTIEAISNLTSSVDYIGSELKNLNSTIEQQGKTMIEAKEINQALLNHSYATSEQLTKDLEYFKNYKH